MDEQTKTLLLLESQKKSGAIAAVLNLVFPGAGYWYCGRIFLGFAALGLTLLIGAVTMGFGVVFIWPCLIIDGFLCADRHNKQLISAALRGR